MLELRDFSDFSITNWYEKFKKECLKTIVIELPQELITKIRTEGSTIDVENDCPCEFKESISNAINILGRRIFIKNNWHAPTDARIFSFGNNLEACNLDDIILYLSNSIIVQNDFDTAKGVPFCLALRKWTNIHPAAEFRCLIINNVLRGITPRDWPTYYAHFNEEGQQIIQVLTSFFDRNIKFKFPRNTYVVDIVYSYPDQPYILDFGPLNNKSNLYAFNWKEIQPLLNRDYPGEAAPVFRFLETDIGIMTKAEALRKFARSQN